MQTARFVLRAVAVVAIIARRWAHPERQPFVGRAGARPGIWTFGHRNPHGLAVHPETGELWESEHGPLGGDEINVIKPGLNYGWPPVTFGCEYDGGEVGDGLTQAPGMEQPVHPTRRRRR